MSETTARFKVPHTLVIIFSLVILASLMTYVIPGGRYTRIEKQVQTGASLETRDYTDFCGHHRRARDSHSLRAWRNCADDNCFNRLDRLTIW